MAPVLLELERRELPFTLFLTGQHSETIDDLIEDFGVRSTPHWLSPPHEVDSIRRALNWVISLTQRLVRTLRHHRSSHNATLVVTHGDTLSTLIALLASRASRCPVAHIEAGLRSRYLLHPFPEEIVRRLCARMSDLAFAPGPWAEQNLKGCKAKVINTAHNTIVDALRFALARSSDRTPMGGRPYLVVSIHRFENLYSHRLRKIVTLICNLAVEYQVHFVLHPATHSRLRSTGLLTHLETTSGISLHSRMRYTEFIPLLAHATGVITDGGSNQEELYYLGKPTVLLRKATERQEGLDSTATLVDPDLATVSAVLKAIRRSPSGHLHKVHTSPSKIIVDALSAWPNILQVRG